MGGVGKLKLPMMKAIGMRDRHLKKKKGRGMAVYPDHPLLHWLPRRHKIKEKTILCSDKWPLVKSSPRGKGVGSFLKKP